MKQKTEKKRNINKNQTLVIEKIITINKLLVTPKRKERRHRLSITRMRKMTPKVYRYLKNNKRVLLITLCQ